MNRPRTDRAPIDDRSATDRPFAAWYGRCLHGTALHCADWERFRDPRATSYDRYCQLQDEAGSFVDGVLHVIAESGYDRRLPAPWHAVLANVLPVLCHPVHGLQMASAGLARRSPAGSITVCALMQTADEIRRIQRFAGRMRQLQLVDPGFGSDRRERWQQDSAWQPLRHLLARLLLSADWGEALVALQFAVKPVFDALVMERFALLARAQGDNGLESLLYSMNQDCRWHRQWSGALLRLLCAEPGDNRVVLEDWFETWLPPALAAAEALLPLLAPPSLVDGDAGGWLAPIERAARQLATSAS